MTTSSLPHRRPGRLAGKVALITGTGGGQGRAAALRFAEEGAVVVGCDIDADAQLETERLARRRGHDVTGQAPVDLGDPDQAARWVDEAARTHGRIDVLYNNAAGPRFAPFPDLTLDDWGHTLRNELALVFHACKAAWPHLVAAGGGSIVNTSSYTAVDGQPAGSVAHAAAKGGVLSLGRALAVEGSPHRIRVNSIVPGLVDTAVTRRALPPATFDALRGRAKLGRVATPDDIVACALYLASDESTVVTGTEVVIGGGNFLLGPDLAPQPPPATATAG